MVGKPPSIWFIGLVAAVCLYSMIVLVGVGIPWLPAYFLFLATALPIFVRMVLALVRPPVRSPSFLVRVCIPLVLFAVTLTAWIHPPDDLRIAVSEPALDAYARTVTATECDSSTSSFRPRWVGLYRVVCARRISRGVALEVEDPLTSGSTGMWFLVGPDPWELGAED